MIKIAIITFNKDYYTISTDLNKIDINKVCQLLETSYWANNRPRDVIIKSLENSLCFSIFHHDKQIGLFRVITDYATFAYLCDVILDKKYHHKSIGSWALVYILKYPDLKYIRRIMLITKDAQEFYRRFGFTELVNPDRYMEFIIE